MALRRAQATRQADELHQLHARLEAADARVAELASHLGELRRQLDEVGANAPTRQHIEDGLAELGTKLSTEVETLSATQRDNYRKHAGFIDVLRRHQKSVDERLTEESTERRSDVERIHRLLVEQSTKLTDTGQRLTATAQLQENRAEGLGRQVDELRQAGTERATALAQRLDEGLDALRRSTAEREQALEHRLAGELTAVRQAAAEHDQALQARLDADLAGVRAEASRQDDGQRAALATLTDALSGLTAELDRRLGAQSAAVDERLVALAGRADRAEAAGTSAGERLDDLDGFRSALATILDRIGGSMESTHTTVERLLIRADALETSAKQQAAEVSATFDRVQIARAAAAEVAEQLVTLSEDTALIRRQAESAVNGLAPLQGVPAAVAGLVASSAAMDERLTAAELVVNQRDDLEMQLDRAEAFERSLTEIDPDRYVTREEFEELRATWDGLHPADHDA